MSDGIMLDLGLPYYFCCMKSPLPKYLFSQVHCESGTDCSTVGILIG